MISVVFSLTIIILALQDLASPGGFQLDVKLEGAAGDLEGTLLVFLAEFASTFGTIGGPGLLVRAGEALVEFADTAGTKEGPGLLARADGALALVAGGTVHGLALSAEVKLNCY